jgi:energy-coupling factor transporter ATP-binding protein EcfA2
MSAWDAYPATYRQAETDSILAAVRAGECVSVVGLSGAGKSNLAGFIAYRLNQRPGWPRLVLIDCNRSSEPGLGGLYRLIADAIGAEIPVGASVTAAVLERRLAEPVRETGGLCLLLDRFDALPAETLAGAAGGLRSIRDAFKYQLTYIVFTRRPLEAHSEMAELFYANTLWLGPLEREDARWSAAGYAARRGQTWDGPTIDRLIDLSWGYPSFLRAACEAYAALGGAQPEAAALAAHPAVRRRVDEFLADRPGDEELRLARLAGHPWLGAGERMPSAGQMPDAAELTAKEHLLLEYLRANPNRVCDKDELIRAVWPEDRVYSEGIRDDSLAQLMRRLRVKVERDPSNPRWIQTIAGRGYRWNFSGATAP